MLISHLIIRLNNYYKENGFYKTINQALLIARRNLLHNEYIIFYVDLVNLPKNELINIKFKVEKRLNKNEFSENEMNQLFLFRDRRIIQSQMESRFRKGANVWIATLNGVITAFLWMIKEKPIKSYYFPLTENDIYLFDNEVLKSHRGQGINSIFINTILLKLKEEGFSRAYIDTRNWNAAEIQSLSKTAFRKIAYARKFNICGYNFTVWRNVP